MTPALIVACVVLVVAVDLVIFGRWAGWSFGLRWWGRPTSAQVLSVEPLRGALMKGGAPWAMREARHRVRATVEVQPPGDAPYRTSTITWHEPTGSLAGLPAIVRVSRTRPRRIWLPRGGAGSPAPVDPTAGVY
ncbi:MAG: hypothetical protein JNK12_03030 [Acidimicrobiales bacterium]|nr:hypothetical protein [Acidimicrobiales bacterium]